MKTIFICIFIFSSFILFAQKDKNHWIVKQLDSTGIKNDKLVILLETPKYTILTTYTLLSQNFRDLLKSNPDLSIDKSLFKAIEKDTISSKAIFANRIASTMHASDRLAFRIGELFKSGNCFVLDIKQQRPVENVTVSKYSDFDVGGTKYCIGKEQILDLVEIVF